jgi:hypothetical protein
MLKHTLSIVAASGVLGFYRGTQYYGYIYKKDIERYNEHLKDYNERLEEYNKSVEEKSKNHHYKYTLTQPTFKYEKPYYFYSSNLLNGLYGTFMYINPFLFPVMVGRELYKLEINMRDELAELKNKDEYYKI